MSKCDKCSRRARNRSLHRFTSLESIKDDRNICQSVQQWSSTCNMNGRKQLYCPTGEKKQAADSWRNRRAHRTVYWTSDYRVRRLHKGGLYARWPVRCVSLTPVHPRCRFLCARYTRTGHNRSGVENSLRMKADIVVLFSEQFWSYTHI